ncbi:MAG TPA: glycosyltransferase family 4 protein, partial [Trueperaceae bacterium]|nr:glycosyltransferase family 4 protein [Trueperaceae bacterium]
RFLGRVPRERVGEWLSECDAFVQPSLYEGLSLAVLEAMARGAPVLVSDIPANRDPIEAPDGPVGWCLPGNYPRAWAAVLHEVAADPVAAAALGERGRARQRAEFDEETMYGRYVQLVLEELGGR